MNLHNHTLFNSLHFFRFLLFTICTGSIIFVSSLDKVILENELCMTRKVVVPIDSPHYQYKPAMVSVFRCSGIVDGFHPALKTCVQNTSEILNVEVRNFFTNQSATEPYSVANHTSCTGKCVHDQSVCSDTQVWDSENCKCMCNHDIDYQCGEHYEWNANLCQCVCKRRCLKKQILDEANCSCTCKPKFYKRCNKKEKILAENNCTCIEPNAVTSPLDCDGIPTTWSVLIILLSFLVLVVLAFDCCLYGKKTGCMYSASHLCLPQKNKDETIPMKDENSKPDYTGALA